MFQVALATKHHNQSQGWTDALAIVNCISLVIFTLEFLVKIIALRHIYFSSGWNIFDLLVLVLQTVEIALWTAGKDFMPVPVATMRIVEEHYMPLIPVISTLTLAYYFRSDLPSVSICLEESEVHWEFV